MAIGELTAFNSWGLPGEVLTASIDECFAVGMVGYVIACLSRQWQTGLQRSRRPRFTPGPSET